MLSDPEFIADADKQNLSLNPLSASVLQEMTERISKTEPALVERAKAVTQNSE
jgi:hypothetical protein